MNSPVKCDSPAVSEPVQPKSDNPPHRNQSIFSAGNIKRTKDITTNGTRNREVVQ
jgi:hypothetical protein